MSTNLNRMAMFPMNLLRFLLLLWVLHGSAHAAVTYASSSANASVIWMRPDSIDSSGNVHFTIGKISGSFVSNGVFPIIKDGAYLTYVNHSTGASSVSFNLPIGSNTRSYAVKAQRYDDVGRVVPRGVSVTVANPQLSVFCFTPNHGNIGTKATVTVKTALGCTMIFRSRSPVLAGTVPVIVDQLCRAKNTSIGGVTLESDHG